MNVKIFVKSLFTPNSQTARTKLLKSFNNPFSFNRFCPEHKSDLGGVRSFNSFPTIIHQPQDDNSVFLLPSVRHGLPDVISPNMREIHTGSWDENQEETQEQGSSLPPQNKIKYSIVPREKSHIISRFLIQHYHLHEPMTKALGMPIQEVEGWFKRFIRMCMFASVADVSVEAIDGKAKKRVGVLSSIVIDPKRFNIKLHSYTDQNKHPVNSEMNEFYKKLEDGVSPITNPPEGKETVPKILEHMYLSVRSDYAKRGISGKMLKLSESLAYNIINCRLGYTVTTSEFSYKIFTKYGYKVVNEIKYADYVNSRGEKIFLGRLEALKPHVSVKALIKELPDFFDTDASK